jgi:hypothetical protein
LHSLIPELEVLTAELIVLILLILGGARLILHEWHALLRSSDGAYLRPPTLSYDELHAALIIAGR